MSIVYRLSTGVPQQLTKHVSSFSDPSPSWPQYNPSMPQCLTIQANPTVTMAPRQQVAHFWNTVISGIASSQGMAKY